MDKKEMEERIEFLVQYTQHLERMINDNYNFCQKNTELMNKLIDKLIGK